MKNKILITALLFTISLVFVSLASTIIYTPNTLNGNKNVIIIEDKNVVKNEVIYDESLNVQTNNQIIPIISNNLMPEGGLNGNFTYGLRRLPVILAKNKNFSVNFVNYMQLSDKEFIVTTSSDNKWRNGKWKVVIYPATAEYEKVLNGYHCWFGYYDENRQRVGTAQAVKLK